MRKILLGLLTIGAVTLGAFYVTASFFSDTETSRDNQLTAGKLDLKIDNTSYYNGQPSKDTSWSSSDLPGHLFFNFNDIKPGDHGEDTISLTVEDNDAWACMNIKSTEDDDKSCTEPESLDDTTCQEPNEELYDGDLGNNLYFMFWADDGDNVLETDEQSKIFKQLKGRDFDADNWALSDSTTNIWDVTPIPLVGKKTYYIGKVWCFGTTLTPLPLAQGAYLGPSEDNDDNGTAGQDKDGGYTCTGAENINNAAQTDSFLTDFEFSAYQHRHNPGFTCGGGVPSVTPSLSPSPSPTLTPTPTLACSQADVILVLDRSGSIDSGELTSLKTAANAFVTALGLSGPGIHAGMSSFATTGSLDVHLTSNTATLTTAINGLSSLGFTNLNSGLSLAMNEHANPGDGDDRADVSSPDKVILITDGHPNRPLPSDTADDLAAATATTYKGSAEIFVVGVGSDVNSAYLQGLATDAGHYYSVADYSGLQTVLQALDLCE